MAIKSSSNKGSRISFFLLVFLTLSGLVLYRLFNLTYVKHDDLEQTARNQYLNEAFKLDNRGNIYFADNKDNKDSSQTLKKSLKIAATNRASQYVYSNNENLSDITDAAGKLSPLIGKNKDELANLLSDEGKIHQVLARYLTKDQADKILFQNIEGIHTSSTVDRFYPQNLASAVLGFVGFDGNNRAGQYGVEAYYDGILSGNFKTPGWSINDAYYRLAKLFKFGSNKDSNIKSEISGAIESGDIESSDLVLTIDSNIQSFIEIILENLLKKWNAESGLVVVQEPQTGKILGMASMPSFDPNRYYEYELGDFINPATQEVFEPGSTFKPVTMSAAIDTESVTPDTPYNDLGFKNIGGYTVRNFDEKAYGMQTMREVLQKSLNTGAIFAQEKTGDDGFLNYIVAFGFGQKTGIDLPGEVWGNISNLYSGRKINFATASFGQGIAVTPIQLINAYSAIANGGKLMRPYIVEKIIDAGGNETKTEPKIIGSPITEKTAVKIKSMLVDVVEKGFDKARVNGYDIAGKTGTAQIPDEAGGYLDGDLFIHDFVGFAPAYSPKFTILIKLDKPQGIRFAADSLSPVFGEIARYLIRYFNIPPTRN